MLDRALRDLRRRPPPARALGPRGCRLSLGILVFQRDLGSSLLFFGIFLTMLYVATERAAWVVLGVGLVLVILIFAIILFSAG